MGLASALTKLGCDFIIKNRNSHGALFENMIIADLIKAFGAKNLRPNLTFWRDSNRNEVDLVIELAGQITLVEIKATATVNSKFSATATWLQTQLHTTLPVVVYGGHKMQRRTAGLAIPWHQVQLLLP